MELLESRIYLFGRRSFTTAFGFWSLVSHNANSSQLDAKDPAEAGPVRAAARLRRRCNERPCSVQDVLEVPEVEELERLSSDFGRLVGRKDDQTGDDPLQAPPCHLSLHRRHLVPVGLAVGLREAGAPSGH